MGTVDPLQYFKHPLQTRHKQYEALRAYYLESLSQKEAAKRFNYSLSTFQSLVCDFQNGRITFFQTAKRGPKERRTSTSVSNRMIELRKKNLSTYEIKDILEQESIKASIQTINRILKDEGFSRLPRRTKAEKGLTKKGTQIPPVSRKIEFPDLNDYRFECQVGGIYYFIPYILKTGLYEQIVKSSFPESNTLTKVNSTLSLLALKLMGHERLSKISSYNFDTGLGFFAGLNVPPKTTATSTYSYQIDKQSIQKFLETFISMMNSIFPQFYNGRTINLDFHSIPHYGEKSQLDKNWVGARHQVMKSALTFLAQDGESKMIVYENADIERNEADEEIMNFVDYWLRIKGIIDQTLVFDSKLTTYEKLGELDNRQIKFITLRRRGAKLIEKARSLPDSSWETVNLKKKKRKYSKFKIYEEEIFLPRTKLKVRQLIFKDHGRELPTFLITNNDKLDIKDLASLYANRWLIENKISEIVDFFKLNALSSPLVIRIYFDIMFTVVADTLYRLMAQDIDRFENCTPDTIFSSFINNRCTGTVDGDDVIIKMKKKATTPIFKSHELYRQSWSVPWWGGKKLHFDWMP